MPESDSSVNNIPEKPPSPVPSLTPSSTAAGELRSRRLRFLIGSAQLCSIVTVVMLICIMCGNIKPAKPFTSLYFLQLDMSSIMPQDVPNSHLINTIAQSLGLRDFYQVGLWNYCEGYKPDGVTFCSAPVAMYAFNPADIIMDQLFAGATIAVPTRITDALAMARTASHWMFALYIVGICLMFISFGTGSYVSWLALRIEMTSSLPCRLIEARVGHLHGLLVSLLGWLAFYSRRHSVACGVVAFLGALFTTMAGVLATVLFSIFCKVFEDADELNIKAHLGTRMYVLVWLATIFSLAAFGFHAAVCSKKARKKRIISYYDPLIPHS